jgi:hypothetical protein
LGAGCEGEYSVLREGWTERGGASGNAPVGGGTACSLLSACFSLGLHLEPEDVGNIFLRYILHYHRTTWRYITEDKTVHDFHKLYSRIAEPGHVHAAYRTEMNIWT